MENNEISKSNKIKIIVITLLVFIVSIAGISYAYFTIRVTGNEEASSMRLTTANLSLVYNDVEIVSDDYITPGWSDTKTLTVTNNGNQTVDYIIKWRELQNTIINGELVISASCASSSGTCDALPEREVPSATSEITNAYAYGPVSIAVGETHTYTLTIEFKEIGSNQNYNQNKSFRGTLNIGDGTSTDESCFTTTNLSSTTVRITNYDETCGTDVIIPSTINGKTVTSINNATYDSGTSSYKNSFANKGLTSVVIPDGVTTIGSDAFSYNQLTSVTIPSSVTTIDSYAFSYNQLTSVTIPSGVTRIGNGVFRNNNLTSVVIPDSVTGISQSAFSYNQLTSVTIPSSVTDLNGFDNNQLTSITIPNGVTTISSSAFSNNQLTSVVIPSSVTTISNSAFRNNRLTSVTIPNSVTTIDVSAFYSNQLTSVVIPSSVTSIDQQAFHDNQLTSVTIPSSVTSIGTGAFSNNQLTSVTIEGKSSSSDFTTYGSNIWGWANGVTCVTNNTSNATNGCITWTGSGN